MANKNNFDSLATYLIIDKMRKEKETKEEIEEEKPKKKTSKIIDKKKIEKRNKTFEEAKILLKKEFFGIDTVIDQVFEQIKTWYIYPEYMSRPTIINLWGLTGVGKTDFVKKLRMFLKIDSFCDIETDSNADSVRTFENWSNNGPKSIIEEFANAEIDTKYPSIILFDEIHRFRTLNEEGKLIPKKQYSDIWKLLSDGSLVDESYALQILNDEIDGLENRYNNIQLNNVNNAKSLQEKILYILGLPVEKSEEDKKAEETLREKFLNDKGYIPYEIKKKMTSELDGFMNDSSNNSRYNKIAGWLSFDEDDFKKLKQLQMMYQGVEETFVNELYMNSNSTSEPEEYRVEFKIRKLMKRSSGKVMLEFLKYMRTKILNEKANLTGAQLRMRELEYVYSKALIFICGNIPKELYEKKKNEVKVDDVKEFLNKLFMPEQISRFGNTYIVYPVLEEKIYEDIIEKEIHLMEEKLNEDFDTDKVKFDVSSVRKEVYDNLSKDYIYNGVRPIYSEVQRVLSKYIPSMIIKIAEEKENIERV